MREDDTRYFMRRAEVELKHAETSVEPSVVRVHHQMAEAYLAKLQPSDLDRQKP